MRLALIRLSNLCSKADPSQCYLLPVIPSGGNLNQCQEIVDWARFCPAQGNNTADAFPSQGVLKWTVTCGQAPGRRGIPSAMCSV